MKKNIKSINLLIAGLYLLTSCSTLNTTKNQSNSISSEPDYVLNSFCSDGIGVSRAPTSIQQCSELFGSNNLSARKDGDDTQFGKKLLNDPLQKAEAAANMSVSGVENPVNLSLKMQVFRKRFLGFFKSAVVREPLTKSFEASLRMRSQLTAKSLERNKNYGQYDLVIVGAGVHGVIALHQALKSNPNLTILLVDEGDTAGAIFRYGKDVFSINSSNRASSEDARPLPGEGNINELPGLPIQVSDLTAVKYPSANDLGTAIVAGLYAAVRENPNVEVLFNTSAKNFLDKPKDSNMTESLIIKNTNFEKDFQVDAQKVIVATGLGDPALPPKVLQTLKVNPQLKESQYGKPPRVLTFEDMIRIIAESNDPMSFFKDKKIGVVGTGDSANVFIEFLLGYAPEAAYARSSGQTGKAAQIVWIGQAKKNCTEFISEIRSRYQGISTGFRSSSDYVDAIIKPNANKLSDVSVNGSNKVNAKLVNGENIEGLDYVVVATGFNQNVRGLFSAISESSTSQNDANFLVRDFNTIEARTSVSPGLTKVGRQFKDREIYVLGTAAGELAAKKELVGIIQNFVSIFNNGPRVVAAVKNLMSDLNPKAATSNLYKIGVSRSDKLQNFIITNIQETRFIPNQTLAYIEATFKEALSVAQAKFSDQIVLIVNLSKTGNIEVDSETKADVSGVINLLAESRDFFSLAKELLKFTEGQSLLLTADPEGLAYDLKNARVQMVAASNKTASEASIVVANKTIKLRGLDLNNPKTYTDQAITVNVFSTTTTEQQLNFEKGLQALAKRAARVMLESIDRPQDMQRDMLIKKINSEASALIKTEAQKQLYVQLILKYQKELRAEKQQAESEKEK